MSTLIEEADRYAEWAHGSIGQTRKYTGLPYIEHPREVAGILAAMGFDDHIVAAGLLHDVLEDVPGVTRDNIRERFGDAVASLVVEVTNISQPTDGNRRARQAIDQAHAARASEAGQSIKLSDIISNTRMIAELDRSFAKIYLAEKQSQVALLTRGHPELIRRASNTIASGIRRLGFS